MKGMTAVMNLGFLSAILPEYSFDQIVDYAAQLKMKSVELACWPKGKAERRYAGVTHIDADDYDKDAIQEKLAATGISISGLGYYPNPLTPDLQQRGVFIEHLKKIIDVSADLNVNIVNTFVGKDRFASIDDNFTEFEKVWPEIIRVAEGKGVTVCIENCPMYFTKDEAPGGNNLACTPAIWERMFGIIDSKSFALNYDPSHLLWMQMDYIKPIYEFAEKIKHFHVKDAKFYKDKFDKVGIFAPPLEYHKPKLPGLGDICWGSVIAALNDVGYKGGLIIEIEDRAYEDDLQARLDSILLVRNFMNQYVL